MAELPEGLEVKQVPGDWPRFREVNDLRFRVLHEPFGVSRSDEWRDDYGRAVHVVALLNGELVGYGRMDEEPGMGVIKQLSVYPEYQRRGVGREIMLMLVERAKTDKVPVVTLDARATAEEFYKRLGFESVGNVFHAPRTYLPHIRMVLDLGAGSQQPFEA